MNEIIRALREGLAFSPDNLPLRLHLARTLLTAGQNADALTEFRAVLAAEPSSDDAHAGAFAAADGRLARIDPQAWHIEGGRLFLNYSLDIRRQWLADRAHFIEQADARWPELARQAH